MPRRPRPPRFHEHLIYASKVEFENDRVVIRYPLGSRYGGLLLPVIGPALFLTGVYASGALTISLTNAALVLVVCEIVFVMYFRRSLIVKPVMVMSNANQEDYLGFQLVDTEWIDHLEFRRRNPEGDEDFANVQILIFVSMLDHPILVQQLRDRKENRVELRLLGERLANTWNVNLIECT